MAGLEELKKRLSPLFDADKGLIGSRSNYRDSDLFSDPGSVNLIGSHGPYSINELACSSERTYLCASNEMRIFGSIGSGASSVVQRAIHIPTHRVLALKRINIFEEDKQRQLLTEIETLCEKACHNEVLVDFYGACFSPTSGHINIALEYVDGGSLADILRLKKSIPEPVLSALVKKILQGLSYLHGVRHLVHRDIKPANLLINLKGEPKITDFGISIGLDNSMAMCATFVGTVTYMSPERIRNESYSYSADIWSLGLCVFECASGEFPYAAAASEGPVNLMLEILEEASPSPPQHVFSPEFCSFIHACLHKDPLARSTADQLLSHPFITRYDRDEPDLVAFARSVFDPVQRIKDLADMFAIHYYSILDGPDDMWTHAVSLYDQSSTFSFCGKEYVGAAEIFRQLSEIRSTLMGDWPPDRLVHVVERLHCRHGGDADTLGIRASGSFIVGNHFLICGDGLEAEGLPKFTDVDIDLSRMSLGTFQEEFLVMPSAPDRRYRILLQHLFIIKD